MKNKKCLTTGVAMLTMFILAPAYAVGLENKLGEKPDTALTWCKETRPAACTRDYRPVCAQKQDGVEKTYANACEACAISAVITYRKGACENII